MRGRKKRNERGSVLIAAIAFMVLVLGLGLAIMTMTTGEQVSTQNQATVTALRSISEAGLDRALYAVNRDLDWRCTDPMAPGKSDPSFVNVPVIASVNGKTVTIGTYTVDPIVPQSDGTLKITSHAFQPSATAPKPVTKTIVITVYPRTGNYFTAGAFGKTSVSLGGGSDSYNSALGPYNRWQSGGNWGRKGTVQTNAITNGTMSFGEVDGRVVFGFGANPDLLTLDRSRIQDGDTDETNDVSAAPAPVLLSDVEVPSGLVNLGDITDDTVIPNGTYRCDSITVKGNNDLVTGNGVTLYCNGPIAFKGKGSFYPASKKPKDLIILCSNTCTSIDLCGNGTTYAAIYAPNATVRINGGGSPTDDKGNLYGSVVGDVLNFTGNHTWVHYDEQLGNLDSGVPVAYRIKTWAEL